MPAPTLERQFDRFRREGDVRALAAVFDAVAPELYAVAVHLSPDLHAAEDLVQSTFLAAIEARDSFDAQRRLLAWLFGILTRKAAWEHRKRSRVIDPQRLTKRAAAEPSEELEKAELATSVVRAVEGLESPYREVLLAHLIDGRSAQEIALALRRAPGTVRVQLHRGLEMLRQALPAGLVASGALALVSARGLSAVRAVTLRAAQDASVSISAGAVGAHIGALGGILVNVKAVVAAAAVLVLAGAGVLVLGGTAPERSPADVTLAARSSPGDARAMSPAEHELSVLQSPSSARAPAHSAAEPLASSEAPARVDVSSRGESAVSGRLLRPGGAPAGGAFTALLRIADAAPGEVVVRGNSGDDGVFRLCADPGAYFLVALADGLAPLVRELELSRDAEVHLEPSTFAIGAHVRGRVRLLGEPAPAGCRIGAVASVEGKTIELAGKSFAWTQGRLRTRSAQASTDSTGGFAIEGLDAGLHRVSVESAPDACILRATREVEAPTDWLELDVDAPRLIVHLLSEGSPVEGRVILKEKQLGGGSTWGLGTGSTAQALIVSGTRYEVVAQKEGFTSASLVFVAPGSGEILERDLELKPETNHAELVIDLVAPDGRQIEEAGFALFGTAGTARTTDPFMRMGPGGKHPDLVRNEHGHEGRFHLRELPPGKYEVSIRPEGTWQNGSGLWFHDPIEVELFSGGIEVRRVPLRLGGRLRVQCSDRQGTRLPAACRVFDADGVEVPIVFFAQQDGSTWQGQSSLNASAPRGVNEVHPNLPPGTYEVRLACEGYRGTSQRVVVEAGKIVAVSVVLEAL